MLTRLPQKRSFAPPHPFPTRCANFGNERENGAMDTAYAPFATSEILAATPFPFSPYPRPADQPVTRRDDN
jgi:hypothetical protein